MRPVLLLAFALPAIAGASTPLPRPDPLASELAQARAEQAAAERNAARLEQAAATARNEADRMHARQAAAASAIEAAEARITAADARLRILSAYVAGRRDRLRSQQQPVSALLGGLALMADRPPLLAIAGGGTDEIVEVQLLLGSTIPTVRRRTAALAAELRQGAQLAADAARAREELLASRRQLEQRRTRFAALEQQMRAAALASGVEAIGAGDVALISAEEAQRLGEDRAARESAAAIAAALASAPAMPPRPVPGREIVRTPRIVYRLPASAPVIDGFGSVSENGIRSRGVTLATVRGATVMAPAAGTIAFAGPFREWDGVVIIDHGDGWISVLLNVAAQRKRGERVSDTDQLGKATGPVGVELSQYGRRVSPALIAGSSAPLSKARKSG